MRRLIGTALTIALTSLLMACSALPSGGSDDPRESFDSAIRDFHQHLLWGRFAEAAGYLPVDQQDEFVDFHEELGDDLRYTEYELGSMDLDAETQTVTVTVTLSWYRIPSYVVQETRLAETWRVDEETDYWWLSERVNARRERTAQR